MNFDDINKIYGKMKTDVYPHVKTVWQGVSTETVVIDRYLSIIDDSKDYKLLAVPYLIKSEEFLKQYKENCIIFYNTPDPNDGLMLFIHQITPTLHVHSRYFCWVENNEPHDYLSCLVFHKHYHDAVKFINDNFHFACKGNTAERATSGFKIK
jgi:hypothetical protein